MTPKPILGPLLIGMTLLAPAAARADDGSGHQWRCWYDQAQHVACLLERAAPAGPPPAAAASPRRDLPAIVVELREQPARWRGRIVRIPLHTEPIDDGLTGELAQAVLCGRLPGCRVDYQREPVFSLQARADLADRYDWLLQPAD